MPTRAEFETYKEVRDFLLAEDARAELEAYIESVNDGVEYPADERLGSLDFDNINYAEMVESYHSYESKSLSADAVWNKVCRDWVADYLAERDFLDDLHREQAEQMQK